MSASIRPENSSSATTRAATISSSIINATRKLWSFHGGIKLPGNKSQSTNTPIAKAILPEKLYVPISQHIGQEAEPVVSIGDKVLKGQLIAQPQSPVSAAVHAPSSGTVIAIEKYLVPHPSGIDALCIVIETDGQDQWIRLNPLISDSSLVAQLTSTRIRNKVAEAGIVGLGGAVFPAAIKLLPAQNKKIDTLIINAAECEPYITCDDMLMREHPEQVIKGIQVIKQAVQAKQVIIGIEDNKPEAFLSLATELGHHPDASIELVKVPAIYPMGGEKQLIQVLTNKEIPSQGLPSDIGILSHNVSTAAAVYKAVYLGEPLLSRIITLTGGALNNPQNMEVLFGTPVKEVLAQAGLNEANVEKIVMGGPMMGFSIASINLPVTKATNCLLISARGELSSVAPAQPCIRCGRCAESCPMSLLPQQMYWYAKARDLEKVQDYNIFDCIECGCCSYVCPSNIPLVQYYRYAKAEIWGDEKEKKKSALAKQRHEFRQQRLEQAKAEKAAMAARRKAALAKKKSVAKTTGSSQAGGKNAPDTEKSDAIKEAMARVQAKKAQQRTQPKNTENLTEAQQKKLDEIEKRRGNVEDRQQE